MSYPHEPHSGNPAQGNQPQNWSPPQQGAGGSGWGEQPGPKKPGKNTRLIVILSALGVILLAGVITLIIALSSGDDSSTPAAASSSQQAPTSSAQSSVQAQPVNQTFPTAQAATDAVIQAYNAHNQAQLSAVLCAGYKDKLTVSPNSTMAATGAITDPHLSNATAASAPISISENGVVVKQNALSLFYSKSTSTWCAAGLVGAQADPAGSSGNNQDVVQLKELATKAAAAGAIGDGKALQEIACYGNLLVDSSFNPRPGMTPAGEPKFLSSGKAELPFTDSSGAFTLSAWNQDNKWCLHVKTAGQKLTSVSFSTAGSHGITQVQPLVLQDRRANS